MNKTILLATILFFSLILFSEEELLNRMVVKVNGEILTLFDLKKELNPQAPEKVTFQAVKERKDQLVQQAVEKELMRQEIKELQIQIGDEELDRAVQNVAASNKISVDALKDEIQNQGLDWETYRKDVLTNQLKLLNLKRHITVTTIDIDEAILHSIYEKTFSKEDNYTAAHIILQSQAGANNDGEIFKQIDSIHSKIVSKEITFEDAAKNFSQDGSAEKGGMLGTFPSSQMVPEFSEKLKTMKEGDLSKPFKTRFGWHIVKLIKIEKKDPPQYNDVRGQILNIYYQKNMDKAFKSWLEKKREESRIEILF